MVIIIVCVWGIKSEHFPLMSLEDIFADNSHLDVCEGIIIYNIYVSIATKSLTLHLLVWMDQYN